MGKKSQQPKTRNPRKPPPPMAESTDPILKPEVGDDEGCGHYTRTNDELSRIFKRVRSSQDASCEHCREVSGSKKKEKGKQQKKKVGGKGKQEVKSDTGVLWVCCDCGACFCGGVMNDKEPYGHARRHSKQDHHPWAVRFDDPLICWCYTCNSLISTEVLDGMVGEVESAVVGLNDTSGGDTGKRKETEYVISLSPETLDGHTVKGLRNLGNTCFFNSVMQNLLAMNILRECLASMDRPLGPLTRALRKLFVDTSGSVVDSKGSVSPKTLFDGICNKAHQFKGHHQQDSHELLRFFLDKLSTEESNSGLTFVDDIFGGQTYSTMSCMECGHTSVTPEPFLDLSLPVPSKKIPPRKIPPSVAKRSKPLRERGRGRKFQERGVGKGTYADEDHKVGNISSGAECTEHRAPASAPPGQSVAVEVEDASSLRECITPNKILADTDPLPQTCETEQATLKVEDETWMDFLGPSTIVDGADSEFQDNETSVAQYSVTGQICQNEINLQLALLADGCSKEPIVSSDLFWESSFRDEVSPCTQDHGVIYLPDKEGFPTDKEMGGILSCSENTETLPSIDATVMESDVNTTSIVDCEPLDVDFEGLGSLFNEPEVTSEHKAEEPTGQEDRAICGGNSSEITQEEVDNTNAPISVESCLALFTKSEHLTGEHAWKCERCYENLSRQNMGHTEAKQHTPRPNNSRVLSSQIDGGEIGKENALRKLDIEPKGSTQFGVARDGKIFSNSSNAGSHAVEESTAEMNISQKSLNIVEGSGSMRNANEESGNKDNKLLDLVCSDQVPHTHVILNDEGSQNLSCHLDEEKGPPKDSQESDSCSINNSDKVECGEQAATCAPEHTETSLSSSCEEDGFCEVNRTKKKGSLSLAKVHPSDYSREAEKKSKTMILKQDATKRMLISKAPRILTVHLKRFSQDVHGRFSKLGGHVSFQETLDLKPYMDPSCADKNYIYQLVGVVEHSGSMTGGHYVAYVRSHKSKGKGQDSQSWFYASDAHVSETSLAAVLDSEAYILFYERV